MKIEAELIDGVIAEYVLGTLCGPARQRCERWLTSARLADQRRRFWEEHLMYLAEPCGCLAPPERVWASLQARLKLPA